MIGVQTLNVKVRYMHKSSSYMLRNITTHNVFTVLLVVQGEIVVLVKTEDTYCVIDWFIIRTTQHCNAVQYC